MLKQAYLIAVTDGSGAADVTAHQIVGLIHSIEVYASGLDATANIAISITDTGAATDKTILTLSASNPDDEFFVREVEHGNTGSALTSVTKPAAVGKPRVVIDTGGSGNMAKFVINYHDPTG